MRLKHPNKAVKVLTGQPEGYRAGYGFVFSDNLEDWYIGKSAKINEKQRDYSRRKRKLWNNYPGNLQVTK